jgi:hypothetical protein
MIKATPVPADQALPIGQKGNGVYPWGDWFVIPAGEPHGVQYRLTADQLPGATLESFRNAGATVAREQYGVSMGSVFEYQLDEKGKEVLVDKTDRDGKKVLDENKKPIKVRVPVAIQFRALPLKRKAQKPAADTVDGAATPA